MKRRLVSLLLFPLFVVVGILFAKAGLDKVQTLRQIERIPRVSMEAVIPGEANLSGRVDVYQGQTLRAPKTGAACVYYHYTVEQKTRDTDGDTHWNTIQNDREYVPFLLTDETGSVVVYPSTDGTVSLQSKYSHTEGDLRYNENRIDPGMTVFAMGAADREDGTMALRFDRPGLYVPILSVRGEEAERGTVGLWSLIATAIGLLLFSLAMFALTRLLGIHMTLAYLTLVGLTVSVALTLQANRMIREDLQSAFSRLEHERVVRTEEMQTRLDSQGLRWNGEWGDLPALVDGSPRLHQNVQTTGFITRERVNLMRAIRRAERIRQGFPERLIARSAGLDAPATFMLLPAEEELLGSLEKTFQPSHISGLAAGVLGGLGLLGALVLGKLGLSRIRIKRWIENMPTVKAKGVVYGLNEIKGTVVVPDGSEALTGPLSGLPCSCYHYTIREKRHSGKKTEWVTLKDELKNMPFLCRDDSGDLPINPEKAELILNACTRKRQGKQHHEERRLPVGGPVYALGCAVIDPVKHDRLLMAKVEDERLPYILSDCSEGELVARRATTGFLLLTFGINAFSLAALSFAGWSGGFGVMQYQAAALGPLLYMILFFFGVLYNDLVFLRKRCDAMWANIDVALKKRFDLLPTLAATVQAYKEHEQTLQQALAKSRTSGGGVLAPGEATQMSAAAAAALLQISGTVEAYPELKADKVVHDLMQRMRDIEDEVALMRDGYNHAVEIYNIRIRKIPDVMLAKPFGYKERTFFSI